MKEEREPREVEVSDGSARWALPLHFSNRGSTIHFRGGGEGAFHAVDANGIFRGQTNF